MKMFLTRLGFNSTMVVTGDVTQIDLPGDQRSGLITVREILDEAQNTTREQMKMFLTRLGFGSKAVITGDVTQIDLPAGRTSGLKEARLILSGIAGIKFIDFSERDVVRHRLVRDIISAYDRFDEEKDTGR
jgi:phosphate starvation-inducible PhoH-like protein